MVLQGVETRSGVKWVILASRVEKNVKIPEKCEKIPEKCEEEKTESKCNQLQHKHNFKDIFFNSDFQGEFQSMKGSCYLPPTHIVFHTCK